MTLSPQVITSHYQERMQRLALFEPLNQLKKKSIKDSSGQPIDFYGFGLMTLLFFFEGMLQRRRDLGVQQLAAFLRQTVEEQEAKGKATIDPKQYEVIARGILDTFRPPGGRPFQVDYWNYETGRQESIKVVLLKAGRSDPATNTQYYQLEEQGLELVFATREYYAELQLSINQLVLRKQLEKGEFVGALRQIDEMRVAVETLQQRILRVKQEVMRNIVSEPTYQRYKTMVEDIHQRLSQENNEFDELERFVHDTRRRLSLQQRDEREEQAYGLILRIDRELGYVHQLHHQLLQESMVLKTKALDAAQEALYYAGVDAFNFNQELTQKLFSEPLPLETARPLTTPFLSLERPEIWSPLTVFEPQRLEGKKGVEEGEAMPEAVELLREEQKEQLRQLYAKWMEGLVNYLQKEAAYDEAGWEATLAQVLPVVYQDELDNPLLYHFWLLLHQKSPLGFHATDEKRLHYTQEDGRKTLLADCVDYLDQKRYRLDVTERNHLLQPHPRFQVQDMNIVIKEGKRS